MTTLILFQPEEKGNGTAVVITPGGGFGHAAIEERNKAASWLNEAGVAAFVLKYRLPSDEIMKTKCSGRLADAQQAVRYVRENAVKWILYSKIGVLRISAGGRIAASLFTRFEEETFPGTSNISAHLDFSILFNPVISMAVSLPHQKF